MRENPEWFDADSGRCVMREMLNGLYVHQHGEDKP